MLKDYTSRTNRFPCYAMPHSVILFVIIQFYRFADNHCNTGTGQRVVL